MLIEWVNHASFVVESGSVHLICDPWLDGTAFNHGWRLISPTVFRYQDFARITHIWFSHEHPDHFGPSNMGRIPEDLRRKITVLFHYTKDKRLLNVCKAYGFRIQELPEFEQVETGCRILPHLRATRLDRFLDGDFRRMQNVSKYDRLHLQAARRSRCDQAEAGKGRCIAVAILVCELGGQS